MVFPTVAERFKGTSATGASHTISMPTTVQPGDLIVVTMSFSNLDISVSTASPGWTLHTEYGGTSTGPTGSVAWKRATSDNTLVMNMGGQYTASVSYVSFRILNAGRVIHVASDGGSAGSVNTDPGSVASVTPPTQDILWMVARMSRTDSATAAPVLPSAWTNWTKNAYGSAATIDTAELQATAASMDPGPWTSTTVRWASFTLAIQPTDFPVVMGRQPGSTASVLNHPISMPAGVVAGELLMVLYNSAQFTTSHLPVAGSGPGWIKVRDVKAYDTQGLTSGIYSKIADGNDALVLGPTNGTTVTSMAYISFRFSGAGSVIADSTYNDFNSSSMDPSNLPISEARSVIWLTTRSIRGTTAAITIPTTPAGWTNRTQQLTTGAVETVELPLVAASVDPSAWTHNSSQWVTFTLAVQPPTASIAPITDGFSTDNTLLWNGTGTTVSGGTVTLPAASGSTVYAIHELDHPYSIIGSAVSIEVVSAGNQALANWEAVPLELIGGVKSLKVAITGNMIRLWEDISNSYSLAYSATTHRWLRLREAVDPSTFIPRFYFETSPDGATWTPRYNQSHRIGYLEPPFDMNNARFRMRAGCAVAEGSATSMVVDNFNITYTQLGGMPKVYQSGAWNQRPAKYYNGSVWEDRPWKVWDGAQWKTV